MDRFFQWRHAPRPPPLPQRIAWRAGFSASNSERVGTKVSQIAIWEHGKSGIPLEDQCRLMRAFGSSAALHPNMHPPRSEAASNP
jgi:hypothetical protein